MNDFTHGKGDYCVSDGVGGYDVSLTPKVFGITEICTVMSEPDARLISDTFTAATKLAEQGYDAVKLISLLPEIAAANSMNVKVALIKQCEVE